ncbi:MAG: GGDEF domain-containing protein [Gemmatimonadaceae bacterium]|nr:GGDEF domain-containing protein [Geodermatophilaceae bacterium]MBA3670829.1 GGDEF domain-containing protein [Gemmatimonadaceae bacterium]
MTQPVSRPVEQEVLRSTREQTIAMALESPASVPDIAEALRTDRQALVREAVLWQRWIRYSGLLAVVLLALAFGRGGALAMLPALAAVSLAYVLFVSIVAELVRGSDTVSLYRMPGLLFTADIVALAAIGWLCGSPADSARLLMVSLLIVQLAVFYFGRSLGVYTTVLAAFTHVIVAAFLPLHAGEPRMSAGQLTFTAGIFLLVSSVLVASFGDFRARMNRLRLFCKLVEDGDFSGAFPSGPDRRPDDLTLLARSFDAMRTRLADQIGTDPLTGCLNRRSLETRLRAEWRQAKRRSSTLAVLAIDLDHFKQINDTRGHPFGDTVLKELSNIMKETARDTDAVARIGGDEFVLILPDTGWQGALTFAERLRRKVDDFSFGLSSSTMSITISVGVALARGTDPISPEMLLQEADRSLYKAKSGGRNRIFA